MELELREEGLEVGTVHDLSLPLPELELPRPELSVDVSPLLFLMMCWLVLCWSSSMG